MRMTVQGNFISINFDPNEKKPDMIQLPDGYSFETIHIISLDNIAYLFLYMQISTKATFSFPAVNSKSPCCVQPGIIDVSKKSEIKFIIEKFGQIPDPHYFDKAFKPILVTGDDGNEYKVIPSDQFK